MAVKRTSRIDTWITLLVFVGVLIVYILTLCPSIYPGGPLNAATAATKTRFIRAVEYPVWRLIVRIFTDVTTLFGAKNAWGLSLFSALCGAGAVALLYRIFARFSHTRTRDELVRYRGQPNLARFAALAAVLLVAFTQSFWRSSTLAGTDTLNMFILVWATHLLLRYKDTRKKRYFIMYGIVYAAGIVNFPTMLLLFPFYLVLSIMWCRDVYTDLVTLAITLVAAAIVIGVGVLAGPASFASSLPGYFLSPLPITTPLFDYLRWYWEHMRPVFPMGGLGGALSWLLWLVLPTLPPVIYLAFTKPVGRTEMGRGSAISDSIFRFLSFAYTLFGIMVLLDFIIGPYPMARQTGFLVAYAVVGAWVCYMLGYWAVIFTGKKGVAGSRSIVVYAKGGYALLVAVFLILPVGSAVKHLALDHTSLAGFTLLEDYAKDTLRSAASAATSPDGDTEAPVVLLIQDTTGDLLRYVSEYSRLDPDVRDADITLVDLSAVEDPTRGRLIDKYDYLASVLVGEEIPAQADPRNNPALSLTDAARSYVNIAVNIARRRNPNTPTPAPRITLTSDVERFTSRNATLNAAYDFVPRGLVFLLDPRPTSDMLPARHVQTGIKLWDSLALRAFEDHAPRDEEALAFGRELTHAAKLANNFGIYCNRYDSEDTAVRFYKLALDFNETSYSALENMRIDGRQAEVDNFDRRYHDANLDIENRVDAYTRGHTGTTETPEQLEAIRRYDRAFLILYGSGLVRDPELISSLMEAIQVGQPNVYLRRYALLSLRVLIDPDTQAALVARAGVYLASVRANQAQQSIAQTVRALEDLQTALPDVTDTVDRAQTLYWIGEANAMLGNFRAAEDAYDEAIHIEPDLTRAHGRLISVYMATGRKDEAIAALRERFKAQEVTDPAQVRGYISSLRALYMAGDNPDPDGFIAAVEAFKTDYPAHARTAGLYLVDLAINDQDYERAHQLIDELKSRFNNPSTVRLRQAQLANAEERFDDLLAITFDEHDPLEDQDAITWRLLRGSALFQQGHPHQALDELEQAFTDSENLYRNMFDERAGQLETDAERLQNENQRRATILAMQLREGPALWYSSLQAYEAQPDEALGEKALGYALMVYQVTMASRAQTEAQKIMAAARLAWTRFRVHDERERSRDAIEMSALGLPQIAIAQLHYAAFLIAEGDLQHGVKRLAMADSMRDQLDIYAAAMLDKLIEEHKDIFVPLPKQPGAATTPIDLDTQPIDTTDDMGDDTAADDTGLEPDDSTVNPDDTNLDPNDSPIDPNAL